MCPSHPEPRATRHSGGRLGDGDVQLKHLYYVVWEYGQGWRINVPPGSAELFNYFHVNGDVRGRINGRFHGTNHGRRRSDETFLPDVQGVIECTGGATIGFDYQGYGGPSNDGQKRVLVAVRHYSEDPKWAFLNDSIAVGVGENRLAEDGTVLAMIEVFEVVWQQLIGREAIRPSGRSETSSAPTG